MGLVKLRKPLAINQLTPRIFMCMLTFVGSGSDYAFSEPSRFQHRSSRVNMLAMALTKSIIRSSVLIPRVLYRGHFIVDALLALLLGNSVKTDCCHVALTQSTHHHGYVIPHGSIFGK